MAQGKGENLEGAWRVRVFRPAWNDAHKWFPKTRDKMLLRSHALKLRFWPEQNPVTEGGQILDMDWEWIKACKGLDVGELRIEDTINGHDNIRIVFYRGDKKVTKPLPIIWVLAVTQKKRNEWTNANIKTFKARRTLVIERFYMNRTFD